jgi:hypothetical protein
LIARGFAPPRPAVRLGTAARVMILIRHGLF